jgi:1,4-dihydroxy-2-naphthoyl-CoA hydrolase
LCNFDTTDNWLQGKTLREIHLAGCEHVVPPSDTVIMENTMEPIPFAQLMGIEIVSAAREKVVARMTVRDDLCTRPAVLHGGAAMAFADTLGAVATVLNLAEGAWTTTIESKTNFLAAAPAGAVVTGECTPIHRGRRTMVWQTRISLPDGKLVALVTQTQLVLEPKRE